MSITILLSGLLFDKTETTSRPFPSLSRIRLNDGNGLEVVSVLSNKRPDSKIVMLTGYGNIPTAVAAVKEGACDYLAKPADADDIEAALKAPYKEPLVRLQYHQHPPV